MQRLRDYNQVDRKRIDSTRFRRCNPLADLCMGLGIFDLSRARVDCEDATEVAHQFYRSLAITSRAIPCQVPRGEMDPRY